MSIGLDYISLLKKYLKTEGFRYYGIGSKY
jgi:hypothetical protein